MKNRYIITLAALILLSMTLKAQDEPLYEKFKKTFKQDYLNLELLTQFAGDYRSERVTGNNGFFIGNMMVSFSGSMDQNFSYLIRTSFIQSPAILEAALTYKFNDYLAVTTGRQRIPFNTEILIYEANTDFVNRANFVSYLAPQRDLGVLLHGNFGKSGFSYSAGAFNGDGVQNGNSDDNLLYSGRLKYLWEPDSHKMIELAGAGAYNKTRLAASEKEETMFDMSARFKYGRFMLSGEYLFVKAKQTGGLPELQSEGYHASAGYMAHEKLYIMLRYENYDPAKSLGTAEKNVIFGLNILPSSVAAFQFNYVVNTEESDFRFHQILAVFQISL